MGRLYLNEILTGLMSRELQKPQMGWKDHVVGLFFLVLAKQGEETIKDLPEALNFYSINNTQCKMSP